MLDSMYCVVGATFLMFSITIVDAKASNDSFYTVLVQLKGRQLLYNCPLEVVTERVDPECHEIGRAHV